MQAELTYGATGEARMLKVLQEGLSPDTKKTTSPTCAFDFASPALRMLVELKTRRCYSYTYPTTIVGLSKLEKAERLLAHGVRVVFAFAFEDGDYCAEYPFEYTTAYVVRRDRARGAQHGHIETSVLQPLEAFMAAAQDEPASELDTTG